MAISAQVYPIRSAENEAIQLMPHDFEKIALKLEDELLYIPMQGMKRKIKFERTSYRFEFVHAASMTMHGCTIRIPALPTDIGKWFKLSLVPLRNYMNHKVHQVFEISSEHLFRLNGQWVKRALLRRGDVVEMAYSRFEFARLHPKENPLQLPEVAVESNLPILIEGATGTGKTTLAREIHKQSGRAGRFVHLNLSAYSHSLIESELFGHVKGAFTGALREKSGALEQAHGGTLFLDEIDSLSIELQTKLLVFLDEGVLRPVGSHVDKKVQTRLITASGASLLEKVSKKEMRQDFYHRLASGIRLYLPSLQQRRDLIVEHIENFSGKYQRVFSPKLIELYCEMSWPGNIRQLNGHLMKKHILSPSGILQWDQNDEELLFDKSLMKLSMTQFMTYRQLKIAYAKAAMAHFNGNAFIAAKTLGVSINTIKNLCSHSE